MDYLFKHRLQRMKFCVELMRKKNHDTFKDICNMYCCELYPELDERDRIEFMNAVQSLADFDKFLQEQIKLLEKKL